MCILRMSSSPLFKLADGRFYADKLGNHQNHHCMPPCISQWKPGPGGSSRCAAAPLVCPHPGGADSRPPSRGQFLVGPRPLSRWYPTQVGCVGGLLFLFPLCINALHLLFVPFGMFSTCIRICDLQNMFSQIQVELGQ